MNVENSEISDQIMSCKQLLFKNEWHFYDDGLAHLDAHLHVLWRLFLCPLYREDKQGKDVHTIGLNKNIAI